MAENIELWSYNLYENGLLTVELEGSAGTANNNQKARKVTKVDYADYDLSYHLKKTPKELQNLFYDIRERILQLDDVEEQAKQKTGVTYRTSKAFARLETRRNSINLLLRQPKYKDPQKLVKDITGYMWGYKGMVKLNPNSDLDYTLGLVKQSYEETL